jgi:hypothetical protein
MAPKTTLPQREKELQFLLATQEGLKELHELASRYQRAGSGLRPARTSVITYILVHESAGLLPGRLPSPASVTG